MGTHYIGLYSFTEKERTSGFINLVLTVLYKYICSCLKLDTRSMTQT